MKTFGIGAGGWRDRQLSNGVLLITSPTGRQNRTTPDRPELFGQLRSPCSTPPDNPRNPLQDKTARYTRSRKRMREHRRADRERRRINQGRRKEIDTRRQRNGMRKDLFLLKATPSTSPWCRWVNDPPEPEYISADWLPPPAPDSDPDEPPRF